MGPEELRKRCDGALGEGTNLGLSPIFYFIGRARRWRWLASDCVGCVGLVVHMGGWRGGLVLCLGGKTLLRFGSVWRFMLGCVPFLSLSISFLLFCLSRFLSM